MTHSLTRTFAYTLLLSSSFLSLKPVHGMLNEPENLENAHIVKQAPLKSDSIGTEVLESDAPASSPGGAEIPTEVEEQANNGFLPNIPNAMFTIIRKFSSKNLISLALTSQTNKELVHQFLMNDITNLVGHYHRLKNVVMMEYGAEYADPDPQEMFRLSRIKGMKDAQNLLDQALASGIQDDKGAQQNFIIVPKSSPLARYVPNRDIARNTLLSQALTTDSYQDLRKGLKKDVDLPSLQHALSRYKVFSGSGEEINQEILIQKAREILEVSNSLSSYISFDQVLETEGKIEGNYLSLSLENYNQLLRGGILTTFFELNMDATLVLDINQVAINENDLVLPDFVKRVALTNIHGNLTEIEEEFLRVHKSLTHFDSSGLTALEKIGVGLLIHCTSLAYFDGSGLTAVKEISSAFLDRCISLAYFDSSGLTALEIIGDYFLYDCSSLTHFDSSGLTALKKIGTRFLMRCFSLTRFDSSGLTAVEEIGGGLLHGCSSLTHFDSSGLTALKQIGTHFLEKCTSLNDPDKAKFIELINKNKEN